MADSRRLAGLIGPTLVVLGVTEAMDMDIFAAQTAPVVYLNGTVLFVAGLAVVRAHPRWVWGWPVLVTLRDEGRRSDGRRGVLAGPGLAVLGLVGALLASGCEETTKQAAPVTAKDGPAAPVNAKDGSAEAEPTLVRIRANVEARVEEDGVTLGTIRAPDGFVVKLPRSEVLRTWVVKAEGYADQTVRILR